MLLQQKTLRELQSFQAPMGKRYIMLQKDIMNCAIILALYVKLLKGEIVP
nr:MAG TPA: hypothetical protein [Caudoviricetes sp.]